MSSTAGREDVAPHTCGCLPSLSPAAFGLSPALGRRELLRTMSAALSMALAGCATIPEKDRVAATEIAGEESSVDLHAHPGMSRNSAYSMDSQIERMGRGRVKTVLFSAVADGPLIGRRPTGVPYATREPMAGELPAATWRQIDQVRKRVTTGALKLVRAPADLEAPAREGGTGAMLAVEGGDFLEGKIERVEEAYHPTACAMRSRSRRSP